MLFIHKNGATDSKPMWGRAGGQWLGGDAGKSISIISLWRGGVGRDTGKSISIISPLAQAEHDGDIFPD